MKTYKSTNWQDFIRLLGDTAKGELERQCPILREYGVVSVQTGYGRFGCLESNYTLRVGKGLLGKLMGPKIFTIHDNGAENIIPLVTINDNAYFGQKAYEIFNTLRENLQMDIIVEYS